MTKRDVLEPQGRELFVILGRTKSEIATRLGVSLRTVQNWSKQNIDGRGTWDMQKADLTNSAEALHGRLMSLANTLTTKIEDDLNQGKLDPKAVANLDRVVKSALKAFDYQKKNPPKEARTPSETRDQTQKRVREMLGLK